MLTNYIFIGIFGIIAIFFPIIALALAFIVRPKKPNPVKSSTYECGLEDFVEKRYTMGWIPTRERRSPELVRVVPTAASVCRRESP